MEVDAQGRLRWKNQATDAGKKPTTRGGPSAAAAPVAGPPTAHFVSPASGSKFKEGEVQATVKLGSPAGADITKLQVYVDGTPSEVAPTSTAGAPLKPPFQNGQVVKFKVPVPPQDCQLMVLAENAGSQSKPAILRLKYDAPAGAPAGAQAATQAAAPTAAPAGGAGSARRHVQWSHVRVAASALPLTIQ